MSLFSQALEMLQDPSHGGLAGVLERFNQAGLADQVKSWIGTGANLPISAEDIQRVLGSGRLQEIAAKAGISHEQVSAELAKVLPQVVDQLTPNGRLADNAIVQQGLSILRSKLGV
jgi:uncharacterized protein YidB (DUF937 family)